MDYKFTKSIGEQYIIRLPNLNGWAIIFLDEKTGTLSIHSDFGNWAYSWHSIGCATLKQFLTECDDDYLCRKFCGSKEFVNVKKTIKEIRREILEKRENDEISKELARNAFEELKNVSLISCTTNDFYNEIMLEHVHISRVFEHETEYIPIVTEYESSIICFMDRIWPIFVEILKSEISEGKENVLKSVPAETA